MKSIIFGNTNTDSWKMALIDVSRREQVICVKGELHSGFFDASTPMCISPDVLQAFISELEVLDRSLAGTAALHSSSCQSTVNWTLRALPLGHIESSGQFTINDNTLTFKFETDQTQVAKLLKWTRTLLTCYSDSEDDGQDT